MNLGYRHTIDQSSGGGVPNATIKGHAVGIERQIID